MDPAISGEHPQSGVLLHELVGTLPVPYSLQATPDPPHQKALKRSCFMGTPGLHILQPETERPPQGGPSGAVPEKPQELCDRFSWWGIQAGHKSVMRG